MARRVSALDKVTQGIQRDVDSQYDKVRTVAENIDAVQKVSLSLTGIDTVNSNIEAIVAANTNIDAIKDVYTISSDIVTVGSNIDNLNSIVTNLPEIINASNSIDLAVSSSEAAVASASAAAISEANAAASETSSQNSAAIASASEAVAVSASQSASADAASISGALTSVQNVYDAFDSRYLGAKASDPTLDNTGSPLSEGTIYYNSTINEVKFWNGATWITPSLDAGNYAQSALNSAVTATAAENSAVISAAAAAASEANTLASEATATAIYGSIVDVQNAVNAAAASASAASTSETNASTSETNAANSATAASTSASNAATSESNAAASASSVATDLATIQTIYDNFDDRYLGQFASAPTLDNDGNSLVIGALYYDSTDETVYFYGAGGWESPELSATEAATQSAASATAADTAKIAAQTAQTSAETAQANAETAETNAATSASNAATSETNAATSASNAAGSATAAATSASNAATSESNAGTSASNAATSETNASNSVTYAQNWATTLEDILVPVAAGGNGTTDYSALHHAAKAATSASSASTSASNASTSESNAATSETNAATSETASSNNAADALKITTTAEDVQFTLSDTVTTGFSTLHYAAKSLASATAAATSESNAATSESNASSSATAASTSASQAATSATNASTSETNAAQSAADVLAIYGSTVDVSNAVSAAQTAQANAEAVYDSFDDRYLGAKASPPTSDNDGAALITGALYFDTSSNEMRVWDGTGWLAAYASLTGGLTTSSSIKDLADVSGTMAPTDGQLLTWNTTNGLWESQDAPISLPDQTSQSGNFLTTNGTNASWVSIIEATTANVTAAGALMDSEVTNLAQVKAFNSADYATAAQGALADTALQSYTETNDLTAAVTWANVPDINITQSSVTQHQAALSITESQISDLQSYLLSETDTLDSVTGRGNITTNGITVGAAVVDSLQLTGGTGNQGLITWNADEETIDIVQNGAVLQVGQEVYYHVRNNTVSTITEGTPVMATGTLGASGRITIAPMDATSAANARFFIGVATEDIAADTDGKVTYFGKVRNIDTSSFVDGDVLWLTGTGQLTATEPASGLRAAVAIVINANLNGTIFVRATNGHNLHESHDVVITTAADGEILRYNGTEWVNNTLTEAGIATSAQGALADTATQPGDNVSTLTNDAGYLTAVAINDVSDVTITTPADNEVLAYDGAGSWVNQTAAEAGLATSAQGALADSALQAEVNDLTAAVVWANVPDANITESSVTQHEAALTITKSQISDLTGGLDFSTWSISESNGSVYFAVSGVNKMKLDASGNLQIVGDIETVATIV